VTRVLLGDLAFLHDVGSLMSEPGIEDTSRVHFFVANDGGGTIFDGLEVSQSASPQMRDRVLYTPQSVDVRALALAYCWDYRSVTTMGELADALVCRELRVIVDVALER
jgi:2-succinyl-5-enolpyruvyl-6-hydroxy-3-cyclohexene-1-carboxylate synthase